jgi:hypothetical protein
MYMRRSETVSTVKKSQAKSDVACALRKLRQDWRSRCGASGKPAAARMLRTDVAETVMPSLRNSPTIRR